MATQAEDTCCVLSAMTSTTRLFSSFVYSFTLWFVRFCRIVHHHITNCTYTYSKRWHYLTIFRSYFFLLFFFVFIPFFEYSFLLHSVYICAVLIYPFISIHWDATTDLVGVRFTTYFHIEDYYFMHFFKIILIAATVRTCIYSCSVYTMCCSVQCTIHAQCSFLIPPND